MMLTGAASDAELVIWDGREFDHWSEVIPTTWIAAVYAFTSHRMGFFQIDTVAMSVLGSLNIYVANTI
jgi:hypothetical protein